MQIEISTPLNVLYIYVWKFFDIRPHTCIEIDMLTKSDNNCFTLRLPCMHFRPIQSALRLQQILTNLISITTIVNILSAAQPCLCV